MAERKAGQELPLVDGDPFDDVTHWVGNLENKDDSDSNTTGDIHRRPTEAEG